MNRVSLTTVTAIKAAKIACVAFILMCGSASSFAQTAPLSLTITGPYSVKDTPALPSYTITIANTSLAIASNISLSNVLGATDGSYLIAAQPSQGTCEAGGQGITNLSCSLGALDPGAAISVNVVAQMASGDVSLCSSAAGTDGNGAPFSTTPVQRTTVHGSAPQGTTVVSISLSANPIPKDVTGGGRAGALNWTLQNSTGVRANKLVFAIVIDNRMFLTSSAVTGSNSTDPVSCNAPTPGDPGTNVITCNIDYLGGSSGESGGSGGGSGSTVTQLQVTVNYISPSVSTQTTLQASGYLSFDGSDSSNALATGQVRVK